MSSGVVSVSVLHLCRSMAWAQYVVSAGVVSVSTLHLGRSMACAQYVVSAGVVSASTLHRGRFRTDHLRAVTCFSTKSTQTKRQNAIMFFKAGHIACLNKYSFHYLSLSSTIHF